MSLGQQEQEHSVKVWDVAARRELASFNLAGWFLALSPDGKTLAVRDDDGNVRLLNGQTGKEMVVLAGSVDRPEDAAFSPDGRALAVAGYGALRMWDTVTGQVLPVCCDCPAGKFAPVVAHFKVAWSPDGKTLAAVQWLLGAKSMVAHPLPTNPDKRWREQWERVRENLSARLVFLDAVTGKQRAVFPDIIPRTSHLVFSPDSRWLATEGIGYGYVPEALRIIDVATGQEKRQFATEGVTGHDSIGFLPDGKTLFKADYHNFSERVCQVVFFDIETGKEQTVLRVPLRYAPVAQMGVTTTTVVVLSPNGRSVAVGQKEGEIELLERKQPSAR